MPASRRGTPDRRAIEGAALAAAVILLLRGFDVPSTLGLPQLAVVPIATAIGALVGHWRVAPLRWTAGALAIVALAAAYTPIAWRVARPLVRDERPDLERADAIVVFSNAATRDGRVAGEGIDRLLHALALRARRPALPLLLSVVRHTDERTLRSTQADQRALAALAGRGPLVFVDDVASTHDEALAFGDTARARRWRRVIAVTSPFHTRRACATLARQGLAVTCVAAPWRLATLPPVTAPERVLVTRRVLYEAAAWTQYAALGWAGWRDR